jgi:hypothetical protein
MEWHTYYVVAHVYVSLSLVHLFSLLFVFRSSSVVYAACSYAGPLLLPGGEVNVPS